MILFDICEREPCSDRLLQTFIESFYEVLKTDGFGNEAHLDACGYQTHSEFYVLSITDFGKLLIVSTQSEIELSRHRDIAGPIIGRFRLPVRQSFSGAVVDISEHSLKRVAAWR